MRTLLGTAFSRWLLCLIGTAALFFLLAAAVPGPWHNDGFHQKCSACQIGHQLALTVLAAFLLAPILAVLAPVASPTHRGSPRYVRNSRSPRAPPF